MRRPATLLLAALLSGSGLGCAPAEPEPEPEAEIPVSDIVVGLRARGSAAFSPDDHLVEILADGEYVYAANSWGGLGVAHLDADGGVTVVNPGIAVTDEETSNTRCTSLALHRASNTLYCGAEEPTARQDPPAPYIDIVDVSTPASPVFGDTLPLEAWSVRDLVVLGDTLLIHQFDEGLWTASIAGDGGLSNLQQVPIEGNVRSSAIVDGRVVTMLADAEGQGTQLRLYDPGAGPGDWTELARLSLAGPPMGLSADVDGGSRVAVGLGSSGVAVVEVGADTLATALEFHPPAVVNHAVIGETFVGALTYSGAFTWDLHDPELRLFGFGPEGSQGEHRDGAMLHGVIHDGELLSSDWTWIERWAVEPAGEVVDLDVPRGFHVTGDGPLRLQLRNPGRVELRAELWYLRRHLQDVEVPGDSVIEVELPELVIADLFKSAPIVYLGVRVHDPEIPSQGEPLSTSQIVIVERRPDDPLPPAVGDVFPEVTFQGPDGEPFTLPLAEGTQTIWLTVDCALMWPELEDLAWLARSGVDLGRGTPVILTDADIQTSGFFDRWTLAPLDVGLWGVITSAEVQEANAAYGDDVYDAFAVYDIPADGVTMDYVLAPDGRVRSLERMYRGPWSLAVPWPWGES